MASNTQKGLEPKTIGIIAMVVVAVALAVWQGSKSLSPAASDPGFRTKTEAPPDSARPPGFEKPTGAPAANDKTGAGE
ncbi:MAG: hypothetical protein ACO1SV_27360 [Fimbriimonas sp.]